MNWWLPDCQAFSYVRPLALALNQKRWGDARRLASIVFEEFEELENARNKLEGLEGIEEYVEELQQQVKNMREEKVESKKQKDALVAEMQKEKNEAIKSSLRFGKELRRLNDELIAANESLQKAKDREIQLTATMEAQKEAKSCLRKRLNEAEKKLNYPKQSSGTQTSEVEMISVAVQHCSRVQVTSVATQHTSGEEGRRGVGKGKGKEVDRGKGSPIVDGYEDLSNYESEEEEPSPVATKKPSNQKRATLTDARLTTALVIHGIPARRPTAENIQAFNKSFGSGNVMGSRWLVNAKRRQGKLTSSMVVFFKAPMMVEGGAKIKIKGKWHSAEVYEFTRAPVCT